MSVYNDYVATVAASILAATIIINPLSEMCNTIFNYNLKMVIGINKNLENKRIDNIENLNIEEDKIEEAFEYSQEYGKNGVIEGKDTISKLDIN